MSYASEVAADAPVTWFRFTESWSFVSPNPAPQPASLDDLGSYNADVTIADAAQFYNLSVDCGGAASKAASGQAGDALLNDADGCLELKRVTSFTIHPWAANGPNGQPLRGIGTVELWIKPDLNLLNAWDDFCVLSPRDHYSLFGLFEGTNNFNTFNIKLKADGTITLVYNGALFSTGTGVVSHDKWAHVVVIVDAPNANGNAANYVEIWVNGIRQHRTTAINRFSTINNTLSSEKVPYLGICTSSCSTTAPFVGFIDELAIYDKALSQVRILKHYSEAGYPAVLETVAVSEAASSTKQITRAISDSTTITDEAHRVYEHSIADIVTLSESTHVIAQARDQVALAEQIAPGTIKQLAETIAVSESLYGKYATKVRALSAFGYWRLSEQPTDSVFNDCTHWVFLDHSNNGHHGWVHNRSLLSNEEYNKRPGALLNDSDSCYRPHKNNLVFSCIGQIWQPRVFSIVSWFKIDFVTPLPEKYTICALWDGYASHADGTWLQAYIDGLDGKLKVKFNYNNNFGGTPERVLEGSNDLSDGQWHMLAITYRGIQNPSIGQPDDLTAEVYVDGAQVASGTGMPDIQSHFDGGTYPTYTVIAGGRYIVTGDLFDGFLDEVSWHETALTAANIHDLYVAAGYAPVFSKTASDTVAVTETVSVHKEVFVSISDSIATGDGAVRGGARANDSLSIGEALLIVRQAKDTLVVSDLLRRIVEVSVVDAVVLSETMRRVVPVAVSDSLTLSETTTRLNTRVASDTVAVSEIITAKYVLSRLTSDPIAVADAATAIVTRNGRILIDHCQAGFGTRNDVRLTYPYISPTTTLILRNPRFGNEQSSDFEPVIRRTGGGQLVASRRTKWPKIHILKVSFEAQTQADADAWHSFLDASAAQEIGFLDQENRQWRGIILPGEESSRQVGLGCQYELSFQFRGKLV